MRKRLAVPSSLDTELELFVGLSRREVQRCSQLLTPVDVGAGRALGREGERAREFTVVLAGSVVVSVGGSLVAVLEPGHWFGAVPLLGLGGSHVRRASFHTLMPGVIAVSTPMEFATLLDDVPTVGERVRALASRREAVSRTNSTVKAPSSRPAFPLGLSA